MPWLFPGQLRPSFLNSCRSLFSTSLKPPPSSCVSPSPHPAFSPSLSPPDTLSTYCGRPGIAPLRLTGQLQGDVLQGPDSLWASLGCTASPAWQVRSEVPLSAGPSGRSYSPQSSLAGWWRLCQTGSTASPSAQSSCRPPVHSIDPRQTPCSPNYISASASGEPNPETVIHLPN